MRNFYDLPFAVPIDEKVSLGIHQDRAAHLVRPVVVMGDSAQAGLDATQHDGNLLVGFPAALGIHRHAAIGPFVRLTPRRVGIIGADLAVGGVAVDHGIHVAAGHSEKQIGFAQSLESIG